MKILRIINSLNVGGAERSLETNVPEHCKHGYYTDILTLQYTDSIYTDSLKKNNITLYNIQKKSIYNPLQIYYIIPYLKKYDIVHVHLFPALYWVAIAKIITKTKAKLIYTEHSTSNRRRNNFIFKIIDKFIYKQYNQIICITEATEKNLRNHIGNNYPITTINNGVNLAPFRNCKPAKDLLFYKERGCKIILQIASFRYPKDQDTVIKALKQLNSHYHLFFAGDGKRINECKELVQELELNDRVHFLGIRSDIPQLINACDIVVMSSIYEGFGRGAIEGMAGKKPVIATDVPGLSNIILGAGLLFHVKDFNALAKHITQLCEDDIYYKKIAKQCYDRAQIYNSEIMIHKYELIYDNIIGNNEKDN